MVHHQEGLGARADISSIKVTIDKHGRIMIPEALRDQLCLGEGSTLDIDILELDVSDLSPHDVRPHENRSESEQGAPEHVTAITLQPIWTSVRPST